MSLNAKNAPKAAASRTEQPVIEIGTYPARVVQIIDLGVQAQLPYMGEEKPPVHEIMVGYELVDCFMVDEDGNEQEDKPRWISESFPFHNLSADLAKSTKRYKALDPDMVHDGDWPMLIGSPCEVTVGHKPGKGKHAGKTFINVTNVAPMRAVKAAKCPELKNNPILFLLDEPSGEVWQRLPEWIQTKLKANLNFKGSPLEKMLSGAKDKPSREQVDATAAEAVTEDDGDNW